MAQTALPTPRTWTAGTDLVTAPFMDGVRDGLKHAQQPPRFMAHQTIAQTIANKTWQRVSMDTLDISDGYYTQGGGWNAAAPTVYTCQMAGRYSCVGSVSQQPQSTNFIAASFYITPNGGSPTQVTTGAASAYYSGGVTSPSVNIAAELFLGLGDQLAIACFQDNSTNGSNATRAAAPWFPMLACHWIGTT